MTALAALWLPILLSVVFVFLISSVIHMALPIHKSDFIDLPDEDGVRKAIRKANPAPGQYKVPHATSMKAASGPEFLVKIEAGSGVDDDRATERPLGRGCHGTGTAATFAWLWPTAV
ncbi:MAG: hypothetical protein ABIP94_09405 [Planctomycetota bacterium]